mgnify:CR=1 FL=1|jgi:hypothetical protein|tara:strand:+ start:450 stop:602 length:153 start_codon:yes stop_codon:yes gene_type:complete
MIQKFSIIFLFLACFVVQSCYTITHPDPCPGLVEQEQDVNSEEVCADLIY